jgi:hypothetical protein
MIWPITIWLRVSAAPVHDERCAAVKHGAEPHGPFGSVACAAVLKFSLSLSAMRTMRIALSSS